MTTTQIIFVIAILMIVVIAVGGLRSRPRVTEITRTRRKDNDEPEDGPDA